MSTGSGRLQSGSNLGVRVNQELPSLDSASLKILCDASLKLEQIRTLPEYQIPFVLTSFTSQSKVFLVEDNCTSDSIEIKVKINIGDETLHVVDEGNGPVNALDCAIKKALRNFYPDIDQISLCGYDVQIIDPEQHTAAYTSVKIQACFGDKQWFSTGISTDIIKASAYALRDLYELFIFTRKENVT